MKTKELTKIAILSALLIVQKLVFSFLPNISLTVLLIILFSKKLNFIENLIILLIFSLIDNIIMGSIIMTPFIFIGWLFTPIIIKTIFNNVTKPLGLALISIISCLFYVFIMFIFAITIYKADPIAYLANDIIFDLILLSSSFLSILYLYKPLEYIYNILDNKIEKKELNEN